MQAGALLLRSPADGRFHADGVWGGLDDATVAGLERRGLIRPIGSAYAIAPWAPAVRQPIEEVMPAITLWQPWASLISEQAKPWEFRSYRPPMPYVGRRIAIHAAVRRLCREDIQELLLQLLLHGGPGYCLDVARATTVLERLQRSRSVPLGAVVCTAELGEPVRAADLVGRLYGSVALAPSSGRWAWPLLRVEPLASPVLARGKQGWWFWRAGEDIAL